MASELVLKKRFKGIYLLMFITVTNPQIVLADEPTAALNKQSGRDAVELMQKLAKEQECTIVLVTHDNRILDIADRIIHMEDGCLTR